MSNKVLQPLLATTFDHLLKTAGRDPEGVALCYKHRGVWVVWSWRNLVAAADRYRPNRRIASAERVTAAYAEIASRLPLDCGVGAGIVARALRSRESSGSLLASFFTTLRRYRLGLSRLSTIEVGGVRELSSHNDAVRLFTALGGLLRRVASEPAGVEAKSLSSGGPLTRLALAGVA
ncbi:MAG TPA: hypothetical protein VEK55_15565 [Xanthobacteraceae bacterium]|nr:hypothetical protein [Xanthobacteraceae bacterium]